MDRRGFLRSSGALGAAAFASSAPRALAQAGEILVGSLHDLSGGLEFYGKPMLDCLTLAVEEQNIAGGLLGRRLRVASYDPQSDVRLYASLAQQAAVRDKVAVVHGGITGAAREAIRPVLSRHRTLYFYNTQYEGGVCDRNAFCTGVTPAQTVASLIPYAMGRWGRKLCVVAADYDYGRITAQWVRKHAQDNGGRLLSTDFFPLEATDFGAAISGIQAAAPDLVVSALVGGSHLSFYRQWGAAGLRGKIPMASTTFSVGNEQIVLEPSQTDGMLVCRNYFQALDTPRNQAFLVRLRARFGRDYPEVTELAMATYQGFKLWAGAVEKAGSLDRMKVLRAMEGGLSIDVPSGSITVDAATHHCTLDVSIAEVRDRRLEIVRTFGQQPPADTGAVCDLRTSPNDGRQHAIRVGSA